MADLPLLHGGMDGEDDLIYYPPGQSGDFETEEAFAFPGASNLHSQFKDKLADQMQDPDDAEFQSPNDSPSLPLLKRGAPEKPYERDREDLTTTTRPSPSVGLQNDPLSPFDYSTQNTPAMHMPEDEEDKLHQMLPQPRKPQPTTFPQRSSGSQISESQERDTPSLSGANVQPAPSAVFPSQQRKSSTSSSIKAKEETIKEEEPPKQTAPQRRLVAPPRDENSVLAKNRDRTNVPAPTAIAQKTADREERRHSGSSQGKARAEQEDIHQGKEKETLRRRSSDLKPQVSAATAPSKPAPKRAPSKTEAASPSSPVRRATKTNSEKREEPPSPLAVSQRLFAAAQNRESKRKSKELSPERTQQQTLIEGPRRTTEDAKKISERLYNRAAANKERRQRQEESLQAERDRARQAGTGLSRGKSSAEVAATFEKLYKASVEKQRRVEEAQRRASEHEVAMLEALRRKGTTGDPAVDAERVKAAVERMHAEGRIRREKIEKRAAEQAAAQVEGLGSLHRKARESVDSASHGQLFEDLYADAKRRRQTQERRHKEVEEAQVETLHRIGVHWKEWVRKKVRESKVETGGAEKGTAGEQRKSSTEEADLEKEGEEEKDLNLSSEAQVEKSSEKKGPSASSSSSSSSPNQPTLPLSQPQPSASAAVAASSVHNHLFALAEEKRQKQEDRQRAKAEAEAMQLREVSVHREAQRGRDGTRFQKLYEDAEWRRFKLEERAAAKEAETERMLQEASVHRRLLTELQARVLRAEEEGESPTAILKEMRWDSTFERLFQDAADREERAEERKLAVIEEIRRAHRTGSSTLQFSHIILPDQRRPQQGRASIGTLVRAHSPGPSSPKRAPCTPYLTTTAPNHSSSFSALCEEDPRGDRPRTPTYASKARSRAHSPDFSLSGAMRSSSVPPPPRGRGPSPSNRRGPSTREGARGRSPARPPKADASPTASSFFRPPSRTSISIQRTDHPGRSNTDIIDSPDGVTKDSGKMFLLRQGSKHLTREFDQGPVGRSLQERTKEKTVEPSRMSQPLPSHLPPTSLPPKAPPPFPPPSHTPPPPSHAQTAQMQRQPSLSKTQKSKPKQPPSKPPPMIAKKAPPPPPPRPLNIGGVGLGVSSASFAYPANSPVSPPVPLRTASYDDQDDSGGSLSSTGLVQEGDMDAHSVPLRENSKTLVQMSDDSENEEAEDEDEEEEDVQIVVTSGRTGGPGAAGDGTGPASPSWR